MGAETDQWRLAAELFDQLVDLPADTRERKLTARCGGDAALAQAVRRLLAGHERALASHNGDSGRNAAVDQALRVLVDTGDLAAGTQAGPFRVHRALGAGGMGQVYLAERDIDGRTQRVALKVPRADRNREAAERFRRERAILATLQHPAIARLIDAGELADGRPYLAMEYVEGRSIIDYCREERLDLAARIRLVVAVLSALQHAHERLILHRDIKAANVMVDDAGQPRLLDFGIGKELDAAPTQSTVDGMRYFSLASAAPEQIAGHPTSAATDVYAAGVLLYELLAGNPPIRFDGLAAHAALERALHEVPPLASVAVAALGADVAAEQSAERRLRPPAWATALRGDLDQILARALRKEPQARYTTADAFAADLRAVLELRPISARSSERGYRIHRFLRRHALAVTLGAMLALSLAAFLTLTVLQSAALRRARDTAEQRRAQAEQVTQFVKQLFRQSDPLVARGRDLSVRDLLDRGVADLESARIDDPLVRAELLETLGDIQLALNNFEPAYSLAAEALALRGGDSAALTRSREQMARMEAARGNYSAAVEQLQLVLGARSSAPLSTLDDTTLAHRAMLAAARLGQGVPMDESIAVFTALVEEHRRRYGAADARTRSVLRRLAMSLGAAGRTNEESAIMRELDGDAPLADGALDPLQASLMLRRARLARDAGDWNQARALASRALEINREVYGEADEQVVASLALLASIAGRAGDLAQAQVHHEAAVASADRLPANSPLRMLAHHNYGTFLAERMHDPAGAIPHFETSVGIQEQSGKPQSVNLMLGCIALAQVLADVGRRNDALLRFRQAMTIAESLGDNAVRTRAKLAAEMECLDPPGARAEGAPGRLQHAIALLQANDPEDLSLGRLLACRDGRPRSDRSSTAPH